MAIIKDFVLKSGLVANTTIIVNGVNVLANDYATYLAALSNDYSTYTTLNERINNVASNVGEGSNGYNANDYNTYTTLVGEYQANDYNTYLAALSNDHNTLLSARANDYNTYTTLDANAYNTYLSAMSNDGAVLLSAYANDGATLLSASANDYNTYNTLVGEYQANDYATYLTAMSNDGATLLSAYANDVATRDTAFSNDGATLASAFANDHSTLLSAYANDYATLLEARSNDYSTLLSAYANDYATYISLQANINAVQDNVTAGGDASNTWVNANDYATYLAALSNDGATLSSARANDYNTLLAAYSNDEATLLSARANDYATYLAALANDYSSYTTLVNEYSGNDYSTYTTLQGEFAANDYNTYTGLVAFANLKANASVNILAGDGITGGGPLTDNVSIAVDSSVVRTTGGQTLNNTFTFADNVVIQGGLVVNGNVTVISTTNMTVDDRFIELGANTSGLPSADSGIYFNRGASGNSAFFYDESEGYFAVAHTQDPATNVTVHPTSYASFKVDTLFVSNTATVVNLNADQLDGQEGTYYLDFLNFTNTNALTLAYVTANGATTTDAISVGGLNVDSGTFYVDATNNYVGVQTETPTSMLQIKHGGFHTANLYTTATTANQVLDSWSVTAFRTAKYLVQVHDTANNDYQASEILLIHDGVDPYITEYAIVYTGGSLAIFNADINGGNARLLVTPTNNTNEIKVIRTNLIA